MGWGVGDVVGEDVGSVVWVGLGVGDESLKGVNPDKENAKKPTVNTAKTKMETAKYRFFMMKHQCGFKFICSTLKPTKSSQSETLKCREI